MMEEEITMSGLRIFKNGWTHLGCDSFLCNQSPTTWGVGVPDGPPGQHQHFCEADMQELIANLPDELLPALAVRLRKVSGSMIVHEELLEALTSGLETTAQFANLASAQERATAILAAVHGAGADPDPEAQLAAVEATVLQHVSEGTEWGQALVGKIAEALPDEVAPDGIPDATTPPVPDVEGTSPPGEQTVAAAQTDAADSAGGETPVNTAAEHACVCGWTPKAGSTNPERDMKAHQRFCEVVKAQKGAD